MSNTSPNTSFLLPEDPPENATEATKEATTEASPFVDQFQMQRALEIIARMEGKEPQAEHCSQFAHVDAAALFWGLLTNALFGIFAFLMTGWAAIFSTLARSPDGTVAVWSMIFTHLVNALCGSVVYRVCYRDTSVVRWDLNNHARYNVKIFMVVLTILQVLFVCLNPRLLGFISALFTPVTVWLGAMRAESRYSTGLIR
jgi:hypothetical protein